MKEHLFYSFLFIFVITALVTLLGILNLVNIADGYLKALFGSLLLELVGAVIGLYKATDFFGNSDKAESDHNPYRVRLNFGEEVERGEIEGEFARCSFVTGDQEKTKINYPILYDNSPHLRIDKFPKQLSYIYIAVSVGDNDYGGSFSPDTPLVGMVATSGSLESIREFFDDEAA